MRKRLKIDLYMPRYLMVHPWHRDENMSGLAKPENAIRFTARRLAGGCIVYWLGRGA